MRGTRSTAIPGMRYHDAPAAIDFLCDAFGFERRLVVPDGAGGIAHAQLVHGNGMVMLGSVRDDEHGKLQRTPRELGGTSMGVYVIVDDPVAHCRRARERGAAIVREPEEPDYGGWLYQCTDPEGHLWSFGSYDPWAEA